MIFDISITVAFLVFVSIAKYCKQKSQNYCFVGFFYSKKVILLDVLEWFITALPAAGSNIDAANTGAIKLDLSFI